MKRKSPKRKSPDRCPSVDTASSTRVPASTSQEQKSAGNLSDRYIDIREGLTVVPACRASIYVWVKNQQFPAPPLVYLARINELADQPEFYHLLANSCTINIVRYANAAGRVGRFDIRHLFNGLVDSYLYHSGRVDTTLPFAELRRRSLINADAQAADGSPDFSQRIRRFAPTIILP